MTPFAVIPDDLLRLATPQEREAYSLALRRHMAKATPLDYARALKPKAQPFAW